CDVQGLVLDATSLRPLILPARATGGRLFELKTTDMNQLPEHNINKIAGDIEFWRSICPQLTISERPLGPQMKPYAVPPCDVQKVVQQILEEGYFQAGPVVPGQETKPIADAICTVVDHAFPAPFVLVYDQVWQMLSRLENLLLPIFGDS